MELHCWGNPEGFARFHADSLVAIWYLALGDFDFRIVPSSNQFVADLPYLRTESGVVSGVDNILQHLKDTFDIDSNLDSEQKVVNDGVKALIRDKLDAITQYTLFLNKENYEGYSRGIFKRYLPFPMQYAPPIAFKNDAAAICAQFALAPDNGMLIGDDDNRYRELLGTEQQLRATPAMGPLHSAQKQQALAKLLAEKSTVSNMRAVALAETYWSAVADLQAQLHTQDQPYIFGTSVSSSDLFLFAHIAAQTMPELPDQFVAAALEYRHPVLAAQFAQFQTVVAAKLQDVAVVAPSRADYASLLNYVATSLKRTVA